jgi:uncharacterized protein (TIGR01777 family)
LSNPKTTASRADKMNILITGGSGFLGSSLIKRFSDYQYTILSRDISRAKRVLGDAHTYVTKISDISPEIKFDAIVNFAGEPIADKRWTKSHKKALQESRWKISQDLVDWIKAAKHKPDCFLSGSAIGFYGTSESETFTENNRPFFEDFSSHLCLKWEEIAMSVSDLTRVVLLRTGIVLAPHGGALKKMILPFKLGLGFKFGSGNQWMSWIHIDDYFKAISRFINDETCHGSYNLTAPLPVKNEDFTRLLADSLHRSTFMSVPSFILKIALGEAATLILDGQRVIPQKLMKEQFDFDFENFRDAIDDLIQGGYKKRTHV